MKYTSITPLNRFPDALPAESENVRLLEAAARRKSESDLRLLRETFTLWAGNGSRLEALASGNGLILELLPLSKELAALGVTGLSILDYLGSGRTAPEDWLAAQRKELARFDRPDGRGDARRCAAGEDAARGIGLQEMNYGLGSAPQENTHWAKPRRRAVWIGASGVIATIAIAERVESTPLRAFTITV